MTDDEVNTGRVDTFKHIQRVQKLVNKCANRFNISPQLAKIIENTADFLT